MKAALPITILLLFFITGLRAQSPDNFPGAIRPKAVTPKQVAKIQAPTTVEICDNGIDDDGNGLVDMKDPFCYFSHTSPDTCIPTRMLWATFGYCIYWVDLDTHADKQIPLTPLTTLGDIAWSPTGILYGNDLYASIIWNIDPNTGQMQKAFTYAGYNGSNGMTCDAAGNIYLEARDSNHNEWKVIKIDQATSQVKVIANLGSSALISAGDLSFLDGYLYASCQDSKLAKIDVSSGNFSVITYTNGFNSAYGMVNIGDGYLYTGTGTEIVRLDPATWTGSLYLQLPQSVSIFGLASYSDFCNSPVCRGKVSISTLTNPPLCSNTGMLLKGNATGIKGQSGVKWTTPSGQQSFNDTITAFENGKYYFRYSTVPDTCGVTDSITIHLIQYPKLRLPGDTVLCPGIPLVLQPYDTTDIQHYVWQDGTNTNNYAVHTTGLYWVEGSNACGRKRDSIIIKPDTLQPIFIGNDTVICAGSTILLRNIFDKRSNTDYTWSNGAHSNIITVRKDGLYWLQASNACGVAADSIMINPKDSCSCNPFYANADLGPDKQLCQYDNYEITNRLDKPGYRYVWQDGSTNKSFTANKPGIYWADVSTYCNTVRDTIIITPKNSDCDCFIYVPSAFTPNEDGKNDVFRASSNCNLSGTIKIYNRWGNLMYSSNLLTPGWDGFYLKEAQPAGVYVYYIDYKFLNRPGEFVKKGSFMLIR